MEAFSLSATKISQDVSRIELPTPFGVGPVNVYIIKKAEQVLLVDAGVNTDQAWSVFLEGLKALGLEPEDFTAIFLTHHHPDHTGLVSRLPERPIYAHEKVVPWLEKNESFLKRHESYFRNRAIELGVPESDLAKFTSLNKYVKYSGEGKVTHIVTPEDRISGFEEWELVETLGHAQSHLSLLRKEDGCFIAGDAILERITSNALMESPFMETDAPPKPLIQYRETLKKSMTLPIRLVLPGHGAPFTFTKELITQKLRGQERRRAIILSFLSKGLSVTFEIAKQIFPEVYLSQLDLVLSEVQGHLDWLEEDGLIKSKRSKDGQIYYVVEASIYGGG